jgi:hypothetical protein
MNLSQDKLCKTEWENIEIPVNTEEARILRLICDGFKTPNIKMNDHVSLFTFMKIDVTPENEAYLFGRYFKSIIEVYASAVNFVVPEIKLKKELKKAEIIKMNNVDNEITKYKKMIYEFNLLDMIQICLADSLTGLYTLIQWRKNTIVNVNKYVVDFVEFVIRQKESDNSRSLKTTIVLNAETCIEKNKYLLQYEDLQLFPHQRELFTLFNTENAETTPKLVMYMAPTGTGKTLTPLGLSEGYKIIFVCVARHIGLSLAKSAVSVGKHIAFAFGCDTASDIRLHNNAAAAYHVEFRETRKVKKNGKKYKKEYKYIDNTVGTKVDIMICDVKSYIVAMYYMLSHFAESQIIMYWDEPTITLDYDEHPLHALIHRTWSENKISKIILSCATLPKTEEIPATLFDFKNKFGDLCYPPEIHTILSYDCKKTISILNPEGKSMLPHLMFPKYRDLKKSLNHVVHHKTLLRYFDLNEIIQFIEYIHSHPEFVDNSRSLTLFAAQTRESTPLLPSKTEESRSDSWLAPSSTETDVDNSDPLWTIDDTFKTIDDINMNSIKCYYLDLMQWIIPQHWPEIYFELKSKQNIKFCSSNSELRKTQSVDSTREPTTGPQGTLLTTSDAHTLTDGPTIYITENVEKMGQYYIQQSKIPPEIFRNIMDKITQNNVIQKKIAVFEKTAEDRLKADNEKEKKTEREQTTFDDHKLSASIRDLQAQIKNVQLHDIFIPNSLQHQQKWNNGQITENAYLPHVNEEHIQRIMLLTVENNMKVLLLLGIGVFVENINNTQYMEIMKQLAYEQKLYLIIASSDYIYGTNYQLCHGFIGKDLLNMTPQKTMQAMGRIGRGHIQQTYTVRFRDVGMISHLFSPSSSLEAENMNALFVSE